MLVESVIQDGLTHLRVVGDADSYDAAALQTTIRGLSTAGVVVVDLGDSTFIDYGVLRCIADCSRELPGQVALVLPADPDHPARRLLIHALPGLLIGLAHGETIQSAVLSLAKRADSTPDSVHRRMLEAFSRSWSIRSNTDNLLAEQRALRLEARQRRANRL